MEINTELPTTLYRFWNIQSFSKYFKDGVFCVFFFTCWLACSQLGEAVSHRRGHGDETKKGNQMGGCAAWSPLFRLRAGALQVLPVPTSLSRLSNVLEGASRKHFVASSIASLLRLSHEVWGVALVFHRLQDWSKPHFSRVGTRGH